MNIQHKGSALDLFEVEWRDWLQDQICSLPYDERVEIAISTLNHNSSLVSLLAARDLSVATRFRLADELRNFADRLEDIPLPLRSVN
jgi:hypothetical protein